MYQTCPRCFKVHAGTTINTYYHGMPLQVAINNWNDGVKDEMTRLVKQEGINSFKFSMADADKMLRSDADMLDAFAACRAVGAVAGVHAELGAVIAENEKRLAARGVTGPFCPGIRNWREI